MTVYIVIHTEWIEGASDIRGVYLTYAAADEGRIDRTPAGRRSTAYGAHNEGCCDVVEREVLDAPDAD